MNKLLVDGIYATNIVKLKDIAEKKTTKNIDGLVTETFTNSAENGIISQSDFFDRTITNEKTLVVTLLLNQMILSTIPEFPHLHPLGRSTEINLEDPE
jgi:type I site-specific deoxyribonuclease (specificity subunit)